MKIYLNENAFKMKICLKWKFIINYIKLKFIYNLIF